MSDASGELIVTPVASPPLHMNMLDGDDCHILDIGKYDLRTNMWNLETLIDSSELFVWVGQGCTEQERSSSMEYAELFLKVSQRPHYTAITRIVQGTPSTKINTYGMALNA